MRFRRLAILAATASLGGLIATTASAQEVLKVGYNGALTGLQAPYDQPSLQGAELAVKQINAAGGIDGKIKIELISRDMRSETAQSAVVAQELVDLGINVMITPCEVDPSIAAGQIATAAGIPAISSCASTPTLPAAVGEFMFANYTADNLQAAASGVYAIEQGYKTAVLVISRDTPYTEKLPLYFGQVFEAKGGKVVATIETKLGQQDFAAEVTKIRDLDPQPDVIMTSLYEPDFPALIKQLRAAGVTASMIGADGIDSPTTFGMGDIVEGTVFTNAGFATEGSPLAKFNADFKAEYGEEPNTVYTATGYDLIKIFEAAVKATGGNLDGRALRDAIDNLENVPVATGIITFKGRERVPLRTVSLNKVTGGQKVHIADVTPDPADVPAP